MLTLALASYEESLCSGCGQDKNVTYNPDATGWFEAREVVCAGCAVQHGGGDKHPTPGGKRYVVDTRPPGLELRPWRMSGQDGDAS